MVEKPNSLTPMRVAIACAPGAYFATFLLIAISNLSNSPHGDIEDYALTVTSSFVFALWYGTIVGLPFAMLMAYVFGVPMIWFQHRYGSTSKFAVMVVGVVLGTLIGAALGYIVDGRELRRTPIVFLFAGGIAGLVTAHRLSKAQSNFHNY